MCFVCKHRGPAREQAMRAPGGSMDRKSTREIGRVASTLTRARANCTAVIYRPRPACESCCDLASAPARSQATRTQAMAATASPPRKCQRGPGPGRRSRCSSPRLAVSGPAAQRGGAWSLPCISRRRGWDVQRARTLGGRPGKKGGPSLCDQAVWESSGVCVCRVLPARPISARNAPHRPPSQRSWCR